MQRRSLLGLGLGLATSTRLFAAASADRPRFLLVFLRGGYDAANLLVPVSSDFYYEQRKTIAIARETALPLGERSDWALHPALRESVWPLAQQGQVTFIPFAGTDDLTRSHFETQDSIELGQPPSGPHDSGFMNRLAAELGAAQALSFTEQLPMCFVGPERVGNATLRDGAGKSGIDAKSRALLSRMYQGQALAPQVEAGFALRDELARELAPDPAMDRMDREMKAANRNAISTKGFEGEARRIARLMRSRVQLGFVDVGGWDTHVNQGGASGALASRFQELGQGLAAFADELGPEAWQQTTVMVISEFGRTFRENGSRGTDHGHGSVYWLLGGGLAANGGVAGEQAEVSARGLFQNRDYPVLNEYRAVLGGLWRRQFGLSDAALARVFPGAKPRDLQLI
ncbi:DUF1501 domain-containing protein [Pelomonas sp. KK5]|uniref:DUF1501 domain-containing protein n=1 Tax=Pelomonas sp. KK5 TaxID=1855730 RepID=UPI00097C2E38|nr:DUF1501 domain-containing protein [Pelomonas sp. KK5]